jgi:hypothetical protein
MKIRISHVLHTVMLALLLALTSYLSGLVASVFIGMPREEWLSPWAYVFMGFLVLPLLLLAWGCQERWSVRAGTRVRAFPAVTLVFCLVSLKLPLFDTAGIYSLLVIPLAVASTAAFLIASSYESPVAKDDGEDPEQGGPISESTRTLGSP